MHGKRDWPPATGDGQPITPRQVLHIDGIDREGIMSEMQYIPTVFGLSHMISNHNGVNAGTTMSTLEDVVRGLASSTCGIYEAFLIRTFRGHAKLDNVKIGDDNRQTGPPHYLYLVTQLTPSPMGTGAGCNNKVDWNAPIAEPPAFGCGNGYIKPVTCPVTCSHTHLALNIVAGGWRK